MNLKIDKSVKNFLLDFGLTDKEITVYTTLLKTGPNTIMNLARETGIKRSTTHNTVEELIKKGLVSQTNYGERRMVIAEDPDKLKFLMEQKKWDINKLEKNLPDTISSIYTMIPTAKEHTEVEIKYHQGLRGVKNIYEEALSGKELRSFVNLSLVNSIFPENQSLFIEAQKKNKDLKIWELVENSETSIELTKEFSSSERYFYKFLPKTIKLDSADILIFDGKIGIINIKEHASGVIISNEDYFNTSKTIFDFLWSVVN